MENILIKTGTVFKFESFDLIEYFEMYEREGEIYWLKSQASGSMVSFTWPALLQAISDGVLKVENRLCPQITDVDIQNLCDEIGIKVSQTKLARFWDWMCSPTDFTSIKNFLFKG